MNPYHQEQIEALLMARQLLGRLDPAGHRRLSDSLANYLSFRHEVDQFIARYFSELCSIKCFQSDLSACCTREGIITFFADVVINAAVANRSELDRMHSTLQQDNPGLKCVYLGPSGCLWRLKPIVCQMFLCDTAQKAVIETDVHARSAWQAFKRRDKGFRWPDQPVLFDQIEALFIDHGYTSPLMYLHNSPGLLRIKRQAQQKAPPPLRTP